MFQASTATTTPDRKPQLTKDLTNFYTMPLRDQHGNIAPPQMIQTHSGVIPVETTRIVLHERDPQHLYVALYCVEDVGNSDYFLSKGLKRAGHACVNIRQRDNEHQYPFEIDLNSGDPDLKDQVFEASQMYLSECDVIMVEDTWGVPPIPNHTKLDINYNRMLNDFPDDKMVIFYHKGTTYRNNYSKLHEFEDKLPCKKLHFVSTPDLLQCNEQNKWLPNIVDKEYILKRFPRNEIEDDFIRIIFPFTNPQNFGAQTVFNAIKQLKGEGYPILFFGLSGAPWYSALEYMSMCDVHVGKVIDNLPSESGGEFLPYGVGAIEAGVYKIPTITSIPDAPYGPEGKVPVKNTRPNSFVDDLRFLLDNEKSRKRLGNDMYRHTLKFHDTDKVVDRWIKEVNKIW